MKRLSLLMRPIGAGAVLLLACLPAARPVAAQELPPGFDETFALTSMNPLLALESDAVVRLSLRRFEVAGPGRATETVRQAVTVLGPDGRDHGHLLVFYDKLRGVRKLRGEIRDARGKVVRKLKKSDVKDYSAISGFSLYDDNRVQSAELYHDVYPYTVEFTYELHYGGLVQWPTWYPQWDGEPVEYAAFEIDAPSGVEVRYTVRGMELEPVVRRVGERHVWRWEVKHLPAYHPEPYGPAWSEQAAAVHTAPVVFEVEGRRGDMRSWASFGQWYGDLTEGRADLPPEARQEVDRLTQGLTDDVEKVRRLYRYLQAHTRYVSVQLGLGGWQPFDATYVHTRGYGDCKALTNYMLALLRAAGITAYPALIRSGRRTPEVLADFPSNQFNHVVLYVPLATDTLWLETTSQTIPFGHLGAPNEDRYALVVKPEGGLLVRTPRSEVQQNRQVRHARVQLFADGSALTSVSTRYTGTQQDRVRNALAQSSGRDREEWLHRQLDLPSFQVRQADFSSVDAPGEEITLPLTLELPRFASRTGTRLFLTPNLMDRWSAVPPELDVRTQPVRFFSYRFVHADTIHYALPEGFAVEAMPAPAAFETAFGRYAASVSLEKDDTLVYTRLLEMTEPALPPEQYDAFRTFLRDVARADRAQVVLVQQP